MIAECERAKTVHAGTMTDSCNTYQKRNTLGTKEEKIEGHALFPLLFFRKFFRLI
jgi:hypothetical protein